mmetsp:Transcript_27034/g.77717  ORF Transcript_27034/g.77717 Transcript_27034/m.77717 type:complete len:225 (-) Transcript_27034:16-690(-)
MQVTLGRQGRAVVVCMPSTGLPLHGRATNTVLDAFVIQVALERPEEPRHRPTTLAATILVVSDAQVKIVDQSGVWHLDAAIEKSNVAGLEACRGAQPPPWLGRIRVASVATGRDRRPSCRAGVGLVLPRLTRHITPIVTKSHLILLEETVKELLTDSHEVVPREDTESDLRMVVADVNELAREGSIVARLQLDKGVVCREEADAQRCRFLVHSFSHYFIPAGAR